MLTLRPDRDNPEAANANLVAEVKVADAQQGAVHIERFVAGILQRVETTTAPSRRGSSSEAGHHVTGAG